MCGAKNQLAHEYLCYWGVSSPSKFRWQFLARLSSMQALVRVCSGRLCLVDVWSGIAICRRKATYNVSYVSNEKALRKYGVFMECTSSLLNSMRVDRLCGWRLGLH